MQPFALLLLHCFFRQQAAGQRSKCWLLSLSVGVRRHDIYPSCSLIRSRVHCKLDCNVERRGQAGAGRVTQLPLVSVMTRRSILTSQALLGLCLGAATSHATECFIIQVRGALQPAAIGLTLKALLCWDSCHPMPAPKLCRGNTVVCLRECHKVLQNSHTPRVCDFGRMHAHQLDHMYAMTQN